MEVDAAVQSTLAGSQGWDQEAEIREDQREEDVNAHRGPLQELPFGVCLLLPLLSASPLRRQAGLCILEAAVQGPVHPRRWGKSQQLTSCYWFACYSGYLLL
jgi:hypothetical protein